MEAKKRKILLVCLEVVCLVLVYFISFMLLFDCGHFPFVPKWFWGQVGLFVIIGVSVAWILIMIILIRKNNKIRIALTLLGLSVLAAILTWWILENSSFSFHIYG